VEALVRYLWLLIIGVLTLPPSVESQVAQLDPSKQAEFHKHVASLLGGIRYPLPAGDTAVSWTDRGPILYFITQVSGDSITSSMAREDGLIGSAQEIWSDTIVAWFHVVWTRGDSILVDLTGRVQRDQLILHGTRDTSLALPTLPWVAADYGLEDQQLRMLRRVPTAEPRFAVFRPYTLKWDTVTASSRRSGSYLIVSARQGAKVRETYLIDDHGLLLLRRTDVIMERRPLEGTARYQQYVRATVLSGLEH
jgi:hypothetical protein